MFLSVKSYRIGIDPTKIDEPHYSHGVEINTNPDQYNTSPNTALLFQANLSK